MAKPIDKARMLMDAADRGDSIADRHESHRTEQRMREREQWRRDYEAEHVNPDAELDPEPDCKHGCNGDCLLNGSDRCTFTCHPYETIEPYFKYLIARLERQRWEATREIYAIKDAMTRLAADEMTRD